jgi:hypothetical protein
MDTISNAIDKLDAEGLIKFWEEYNKSKEEQMMDDKQIWEEIQEATKKLNSLITTAVRLRGLYVQVEIDHSARLDLMSDYPNRNIPRISVSVMKAMRDMTWD